MRLFIAIFSMLFTSMIFGGDTQELAINQVDYHPYSKAGTNSYIDLEFPHENAQVDTEYIVFKGYVKNATELSLNNVEVPVGVDGSFFYKTILTSLETPNTFFMEAYNKEGPIDSLTRTVVYKPKNNKPFVDITFPPNDYQTHQDVVIFNGKAKHVSTLSIQDSLVSIDDDGYFSHPVYIDSRSPQQSIILKAVSSKGDSIMMNRTIRSKSFSESKVGFNSNNQSFSEKMTQNILSLKTDMGLDLVASYSFQNMTLDGFINIFSSEYDVNILHLAKENQSPLSVSIVDMHPADIFNTLIESWGASWSYDNKLIKVEDGAPIRIFSIQYLEIDAASAMIKAAVPGITISENQDTTQLIVQGSSQQLNHVDMLLSNIDIQPKQVLIEARIIESSIDFQRVLGLDITKVEPGENVLNAPPIFMPSAGVVSILNNHIPIDALENSSDINVIASPKLLVMNHKTASISTGHSYGYSTVSTTITNGVNNTQETIQSLETGVNLSITPHINELGEITMDINPSITEGLIENNRPRSSTTQANTQVVVKDGQTVVIGGLIQKKIVKASKTLPVVSKIPIMNKFLERNESSERQLELTVLITPKIVSIDSPSFSSMKYRGK